METALQNWSVPISTHISLKALFQAPSPGVRSSVGVVIFAHGSGSSRLSPRNQWVAQELRSRGIATVLLDLLTEQEAQDRSLVFDVRLLADRLIQVSLWCQQELLRYGWGQLPFGLFGASTGAAAALLAAPYLDELPLVAIVSRGGRADLAGAGNLRKVKAPTLFLVGERDEGVVELNRKACKEVQSGEIRLIPGATHLFEEPGTLDQVSALAGDWFLARFEGVRKRKSDFKKSA